MEQATSVERWAGLLLCALLVSACGPQPAEPARPAAAPVSASAPDAAAEQAAEAVAAYFAGAELQAETDAQRQELRRAFADLIEKRFDLACKRLGLNREGRDEGFDTSRFRPPRANERQGELF